MAQHNIDEMITISRNMLNSEIAAAVQAERDEMAKALPLTIKTSIEAEREACAQAVEQAEHDGTHAQFVMRSNCAAAIRARSNGK